MRWAIFLALGACYSPATRDCTVSCSAASDCAGGQTCSSDGFCAASGHTCSTVDARIAVDAAAIGSLQITIMGPGQVTVAGVGTCSSDMAPHGQCTFPVTIRVNYDLSATAMDQDKPFSGWSQACSGTAATCALTPTAATTIVGASFK